MGSLGCKSPVGTVVRVQSSDFENPTRSAIKVINGFVGCNFLEFTSSDDASILVKAADGEPCSTPLHGLDYDDEFGHSAVAYHCFGGDADYSRAKSFEVLVSFPGNIHTQACIVAHELGHTLGLPDGGRGMMNQHECPDFIRLSDAETDFLKRRFCK